MFDQTKYIQNSYSIAFPRYSQIRRRANEFEDLLKDQFEGHYSQPQVISIPDELDPEVPRMIFGSKHGFSQIVISQISVSLNVIYSPDWQLDISKGREYLKERISALYRLHDLLESVPVLFSGLITKVQLPSKVEETILFEHLYRNVSNLTSGDDIYDINVKFTNVIKEKYFNNITVLNYRTWDSMNNRQTVPRLSRKSTCEYGIEIISDFNDRYAYNEKSNYFSSGSIAVNLIDEGISRLNEAILKIKGV